MKKLTLLTVLILYGLIGFSQLNAEAKYLRKNVPDIYNPIKVAAVYKWENDNQMIVYTINLQAKAYYEYIDYIKIIPRNVIIIFIQKWGGKINGVLTVDYEMVVYEMKLYLKNSDY